MQKQDSTMEEKSQDIGRAIRNAILCNYYMQGLLTKEEYLKLRTKEGENVERGGCRLNQPDYE